jgi:hypothetical protein
MEPCGVHSGVDIMTRGWRRRWRCGVHWSGVRSGCGGGDLESIGVESGVVVAAMWSPFRSGKVCGGDVESIQEWESVWRRCGVHSGVDVVAAMWSRFRSGRVRSDDVESFRSGCCGGDVESIQEWMYCDENVAVAMRVHWSGVRSGLGSDVESIGVESGMFWWRCGSFR